ncbi:response regulator [Carboxylicivirga sp. N1Y90]|uniref:response regulator n=1 Tax=Carboxylicivirga fragile TaxID=3417571 RepID=UPI003D344A2C|nr:response regulator [Marinilabiliaceae bacterium N1Y90]
MKKILIIDDAPDSRLILKTLLSKYDVSIVEAEDGLDGWNKIVKEQPDLVLLDIHMPKKDGFSILEDLEEEWLGVPVVVVSGDTTDDTVQTCDYYGAKAFLKKPVILNDFKEAIKVVNL